MRKNKRGLSPVITTALLIVLAITLAIIILMWAIKFIPEKILKDGRPVEDVCREVSFEAGLGAGGAGANEIIVSNTGDISIYAFSIESETPGKTTTIEKIPQDIVTGSEISLGIGGSGKLSVSLSGVEKVIIKPVLLGLRGEKEDKSICNKHQGAEIVI